MTFLMSHKKKLAIASWTCGASITSFGVWNDSKFNKNLLICLHNFPEGTKMPLASFHLPLFFILETYSPFFAFSQWLFERRFRNKFHHREACFCHAQYVYVLHLTLLFIFLLCYTIVCVWEMDVKEILESSLVAFTVVRPDTAIVP